MENSFWQCDIDSEMQGGSIKEGFDNENIGGKDFKNAHDIDSEFVPHVRNSCVGKKDALEFITIIFIKLEVCGTYF